MPLWQSWKSSTAPRPEIVQVPIAAPPELQRGPLGRRQIALTFDAGDEATDLPQLLADLQRLQVRATFFLTGRWCRRHPREVTLLAQSSHAIGNHSWAHPAYTSLPDEGIRQDLLRADALLNSLFGHSVRPLFRPPFGDRDERVLRILAENGYRSIYWTLDTLDSIEPRKTPAFLAARVLDQTDDRLDGAIILSHVGYPETCAAAPVIITKLRARGFSFVTVPEWLPQL